MSPTIPDIPSLHDAVLAVVSNQWSQEGVQLRVVLGLFDGPSITVVCEGLRELSLGRRDEWGPSDVVNESSCTRTSNDEIRWELEMQSGDRIVVVADWLQVLTNSPSPTVHLTVEDGFAAMFEFLNAYWAEMPSVEVADVLSESSPAYGGVSRDPAAWHRWQTAVRKVLDSRSPD